MHLDDDTCETIAEALTTNSFLTSLDIRQNPRITNVGYKAILGSLERNYDLWCSVMVMFFFVEDDVKSCSPAFKRCRRVPEKQDNESFQAKFNALIELNQANRGDLVRSPTREKLAEFMGKLRDNNPEDPTSLWYFLTIHDSILHPLAGFLKWKDRKKQGDADVSQDGSDDNDTAVNAKRAALAVSPEEDAKRPKLLPSTSEQAPS
ncbi:MAG: hypothetical protein SGARI_003672 [Bacillariaceae sp.]